jgi:CRP/FNR family transcriptional regulator, dissimilatory nitrate respiration regulator
MDQTQRMVLLRSLPFFGGLPEERLARLARGAVVSTHAPGDVIAAKDQPGDAFYLVASGRAKLFQIGTDGREQTLYILGPGEPFCLCSLIDSGEFPAFAAALTETRILTFPAKALAAAAKDDPDVLFDLLRLMCGRLKDAMGMVASLALLDLPGRVSGFLLHEAKRGPGDDVVRLDISQRELAKIVGATPEALSRALRRLAEAGLITVRGREVEIRDRAGLTREAGLPTDEM